MPRFLAFCRTPLSVALPKNRRVSLTLTTISSFHRRDIHVALRSLAAAFCTLLFLANVCSAQYASVYLTSSSVGTGSSVQMNSSVSCDSDSGPYPTVSFYAATTPNATSGTFIGSNSPGSRAASGPVSWTPSTAGTYYIGATASGGQSCESGEIAAAATTKLVVAATTLQGYINPKYIVVGVTYAPPGPNSYVSYTNTAALSNTSSTSQTFNGNTTTTISLMRSGSIPKVLSGSITATSSTTFQQSVSTTKGITLSQMSQRSTKVMGPSNAYAPVNHDYDIIWVWLNPVAIYTVPVSGSGSVTWNGYGFDAADQPDLDIYPFTAGLLNGHLGSNPYGTQLSRSWATGQNYASGDGPALNQTDINNILAADPYTNPASSYTFTLSATASPATTTDGRFTLSGASGGAAQDFIYQQAAPGGQPITETYQNGYSSMSSLGSSTSSMTSQTFGIDKNFAAGSWVGRWFPARPE